MALALALGLDEAGGRDEPQLEDGVGPDEEDHLVRARARARARARVG